MNFRCHLANYVLGYTGTTLLPSAAIDALNEGLDSPSLRILAGMDEKDNAFEIESYFNATLRELNMGLPSTEEAQMILLEYLIEEILSGRLEIVDGLNQVIYKVTHANHGMDWYVFIKKIQFEKLHSLYWQYDDLKEQYFWNNTTEEKLNDLKTQMRNEIIKLKQAVFNHNKP